MVDHLRLPNGTDLANQRARGNPVPEVQVSRVGRSRLLESSMSVVETSLDGGAIDDEEEDARAVLKFRANTRITTGPLSRLRFVPIGEDEDWTYYVLSSRESRLALRALIAEYGQLPDGVQADVDWDRPKSWAGFLDHLEGVELYGPEDRSDPTLGELSFEPSSEVDVLLWPAGNQETASARIQKVADLVEAHDRRNRSGDRDGVEVRVVAFDSRPDRTVVRIATDSLLLTALLELADVERVRAPLRAAISQKDLTQYSAPDELPDPAQSAVGVVDGVISAANPLVAPYVLDRQSFPAGHTFAGPDEHGTNVAGCAIWGDLDATVAGGPLLNPHPIVSARVLEPRSRPDGSVVNEVVGLPHETVEAAVRWLVEEHEVRVICISIAYASPANTALRNEFTLTLDQLARELDVVIVVAAGNRLVEPVGGWLADYPNYVFDSDSGVASPGDGAIVVTTGSIAKRSIASSRHGAARVAIAG